MKSPKPPPIARFVIADEPLPEPSLRDRLAMELRPWGSSAFVHGAALIILLLWTIPIVQRGSLTLTAFTGLADSEVEELTFSTEDSSAELSELETDELFAAADFTIEQPLLEEPNAPAVFDQPEEEIIQQPELVKPTSGSRHSIAAGSLSDVDSIEQAVDQITGGIRGRLQGGDVLVVWLLDASLSLKDDRQRVARRLETFLTDISNSAASRDHRLLNAVVSYASSVKELIAPTKASEPILYSIKTAPTDSSGKENVFIAVEKCVLKYRKKWKSQMMIVVWTDESGDDVVRLPKAIDRCQKSKVSVSVVGPSAVLGADTGLHAYTDPKTNLTYQLPVKRGPDAAMPERIRLGYWFPSSNRRQPSWYGGDELQGITSGFSPYALTRLATLTGGSYTIFDRPEDRAPFDLERMKEYLPAYGSTTEYREQIEQYPLRKAVHAAVKVTYAEEIDAPNLMFFGQRSPDPPYKVDAFYFTPDQFRTKLRTSRGKIQRQIAHAAYVLNKAIQEVSNDGQPEQGLDYEYQNESSPRWRAWYDLTRGRLLATSVRLEEYRLAFEEATDKEYLNADTNGLMMMPTTRMRSNEKFTRRAEEAADLLSRCRWKNMDTPWSYLAERELANGLGVIPKQLVLQPTGQIQQRREPKLPKF